MADTAAGRGVIVPSGPNPPTGNSDAASCGTFDYEVRTERSQRRQTAIAHRASSPAHERSSGR
jgi:hypothetical protein